MPGKSAIPAARGERDANHAELAALYEQLGCSVVDTHTLGFGIPDSIVGVQGGAMCWVEYKTADGEMNAAQQAFTERWRGPPVRLVRNSQDVIEHVTEIRRAIRRARV